MVLYMINYYTYILRGNKKEKNILHTLFASEFSEEQFFNILFFFHIVQLL